MSTAQYAMAPASPPDHSSATIRSPSISSLARMAASGFDTLWFSDTRSRETLQQVLKRGATPTMRFQLFLENVLNTTQVSHSVVILALLLVHRLKINNLITASRGSEYRLAITALMLANKYLDDNTYLASVWSEVAFLELQPLIDSEREFLKGINFDLHVSKDEFVTFSRVLTQSQLGSTVSLRRKREIDEISDSTPASNDDSKRSSKRSRSTTATFSITTPTTTQEPIINRSYSTKDDDALRLTSQPTHYSATVSDPESSLASFKGFKGETSLRSNTSSNNRQILNLPPLPSPEVARSSATSRIVVPIEARTLPATRSRSLKALGNHAVQIESDLSSHHHHHQSQVVNSLNLNQFVPSVAYSGNALEPYHFAGPISNQPSPAYSHASPPDAERLLKDGPFENLATAFSPGNVVNIDQSSSEALAFYPLAARKRAQDAYTQQNSFQSPQFYPYPPASASTATTPSHFPIVRSRPTTSLSPLNALHLQSTTSDYSPAGSVTYGGNYYVGVNQRTIPFSQYSNAGLPAINRAYVPTYATQPQPHVAYHSASSSPNEEQGMFTYFVPH